MSRYNQYLTFFVFVALSFGASAQVTDTFGCVDAKGDPAVLYKGDYGNIYVSAAGVTRNDDYYPFGDETVISKTSYMNVDFASRMSLKYRVLTRFAFKTGNQIVFIETTRSRKKNVSAYVDSFVSESLDDFSAPSSFNQNVLTFDKNDQKVTGRYVHMEQVATVPEWADQKPVVPPVLSMDDIRDPKLFLRKDLQEAWGHILNGELDYGYFYPDSLVRASCN